MATHSRPNRRNRYLFIFVALIFALIFLPIIISQFTPILMVWALRPLINTAEYGQPANAMAIQQNIETVYDLEYSEQAYGTLDIYVPADAIEPLPVVMYIHGGGFIGGDKSLLEPFSKSIANEGYVVANVNYALAPENPYPTATLQLHDAIAYLVEHIEEYGGDANQFFIAGNSAGAHFSSQLAAIITNPDLAVELGISPALSPEQLQGVALINGVFNMQTIRETGFPGIGLYLWAYTGQKDFESYERIDEISTIQQITPEYPPVFITVGDIDPLKPQTEEFFAELEANDIDVTSRIWTATSSELDHDFILYLDRELSQQTFQEMIGFFEAHSGK